MICKRCGRAMREQKRTFHKQRKWMCPRCGKARMERVGARAKRGGRKAITPYGDES